MKFKIDRKYIEDFKRGYVAGFTKGAGGKLSVAQAKSLKSMMEDENKVMGLINEYLGSKGML